MMASARPSFSSENGHLADPRWPVRPDKVRVLEYQGEELLNEDVIRYGRRNDLLDKAFGPHIQQGCGLQQCEIVRREK